MGEGLKTTRAASRATQIVHCKHCGTVITKKDSTFWYHKKSCESLCANQKNQAEPHRQENEMEWTQEETQAAVGKLKKMLTGDGIMPEQVVGLICENTALREALERVLDYLNCESRAYQSITDARALLARIPQ